MEWKIELLKVAGSAFLGFFIGRFQTTYNDRIARNKDVQSELLKAIRACSVASIDYHGGTHAADQRVVKAHHLKFQLWRIRGDLLLSEKACSIAKGSLIKLYVDYFDAVTEYPFEPAELVQPANNARIMRISTSGESLASAVAEARPRLF